MERFAVPDPQSLPLYRMTWNGENEEWFCAKCGRTSDHIKKEDAFVELEKFECVLPTVTHALPS
ncbi:MAG: hypothetical protein DMG86_21920 [Acidobacteria bacterium]|nr:MAG: hypothetical protein DMG86_21920 [Acidobacteriota bacterium]PYX02384.1 MAG: hypothetical protein DMG85_21520 [Acidobacteriota bacterium]